jgi:uncharacterized protein
MEHSLSINDCWVLHDGAAGNRLQALALCKAMVWNAQEIYLTPNTRAHCFSPHLFPNAKHALGNAFNQLFQSPQINPIPKLAIGCGRQAALATRLLKQHYGTYTIQLLDPKINTRYWDVVIAPAHDQRHGNNLISTLGSVHDINAVTLNHARDQFAFLESLPKPRTAVLIGGPSKMANVNAGMIEVMFSQLEYTLAQQGGSLIICGSRRTPVLFAQQLRQRFSDSPHRVWFDESDGENFYRGALAWADRIIVTPDSVNMLSEASATSAPVFVAQPKAAGHRMQVFLQSLTQLGRINPQTRELIAFPVKPLDTITELVDQLKQRLPAD